MLPGLAVGGTVLGREEADSLAGRGRYLHVGSCTPNSVIRTGADGKRPRITDPGIQISHRASSSGPVGQSHQCSGMAVFAFVSGAGRRQAMTFSRTHNQYV